MIQKRIFFKQPDGSAGLALLLNARINWSGLKREGWIHCSLKEYRKLEAVKSFAVVKAR